MMIYLVPANPAGMMLPPNAVSGAYQPYGILSLTCTELGSILSEYVRWAVYPPVASNFYAVPISGPEHFSPAATLQAAKLAQETIAAFADLKEDWDGYGAAAISSQVRSNAEHFIGTITASDSGLSVPEPVPTPSGTVSLEWETESAEAYIEIGNTRYSGFIKTGPQQFIPLEGRADSMGRGIVALIQSVISMHITYANTVTQILAA